jgi:hypothetical protein
MTGLTGGRDLFLVRQNTYDYEVPIKVYKNRELQKTNQWISWISLGITNHNAPRHGEKIFLKDK